MAAADAAVLDGVIAVSKLSPRAAENRRDVFTPLLLLLPLALLWSPSLGLSTLPLLLLLLLLFKRPLLPLAVSFDAGKRVRTRNSGHHGLAQAESSHSKAVPSGRTRWPREEWFTRRHTSHTKCKRPPAPPTPRQVKHSNTCTRVGWPCTSSEIWFKEKGAKNSAVRRHREQISHTKERILDS